MSSFIIVDLSVVDTHIGKAGVRASSVHALNALSARHNIKTTASHLHNSLL